MITQRKLRAPLALAVAAALHCGSAAADATLDVYVFSAGVAADGVAVTLDDRGAATGANGGVRLSAGSGEHRIAAAPAGMPPIEIPLAVDDGEHVQISIALYAGRAPVYRIVSSTSGEHTVDLAATDSAELTGTVVDADGAPAADTEVSLGGASTRTDADGRYVLRTRPGTYALAIIADGYAPASQPALSVHYGRQHAEPIALVRASAAAEQTPASSAGMLSNVLVEAQIEREAGGQYEAAIERRESAQVTDAMSAEQIARSGDSDAAGALARVTGLTLVDDSFVYVRGLGERYSSVLLNGAQIPSPDPTRRVVPLDLFPSDLLDRLVVQKTYSAQRPGEFGGGTIEVQTRSAADERVLRVGGSLGWNSETTGEEGLRYRGGGRDWTGHDDGAREAPSGLVGSPLPGDPAALAAIGDALAAKGFAIDRRGLGPATGFSTAAGNRWAHGDDGVEGGLYAALRYDQRWEHRDEVRRGYSLLADGGLAPALDYRRERTERAIDAGLFVAGDLRLSADHALYATAFQVRQTTDEARIDTGLQSSGNLERQYELEWVENALTVRQFGGGHRLGEATFDWQYTRSDASRDAPSKREYRYTYDDVDQVYRYDGLNFIRFEALDDDVEQARLDLAWPWQFDAGTATLRAGIDRLDRERVSGIRRYNYRGPRPLNVGDIDAILHPDNIGPDGLQLQESTQATDSYTAGQAIDAAYLSGDIDLDRWRFDIGMREERHTQQVVTRQPFDASAAPIAATQRSTDRLPSAALTWRRDEDDQFRIGGSRTVIRPDFRELSTASYVDPLLDIRVTGNPLLEQSEITAFDLRWEHYYSDAESVSVALFERDIDRPIELVRVPASGELLNLANADSATNRGIEFDVAAALGSLLPIDPPPGPLPWDDLYLAANYARIESDVELGASAGTQTNAQRPLQGQSPYVANLALTWLDPDGMFEATLLYNEAGRRIAQVGDSGLPDIYEQPFRRLDFTLASTLPWDGWKLKLKLRNLLDPQARQTQRDELVRAYRKGRDVSLSLEWSW